MADCPASTVPHSHEEEENVDICQSGSSSPSQQIVEEICKQAVSSSSSPENEKTALSESSASSASSSSENTRSESLGSSSSRSTSSECSGCSSENRRSRLADSLSSRASNNVRDEHSKSLKSSSESSSSETTSRKNKHSNSLEFISSLKRKRPESPDLCSSPCSRISSSCRQFLSERSQEEARSHDCKGNIDELDNSSGSRQDKNGDKSMEHISNHGRCGKEGYKSLNDKQSMDLDEEENIISVTVGFYKSSERQENRNGNERNRSLNDEDLMDTDERNILKMDDEMDEQERNDNESKDISNHSKTVKEGIRTSHDKDLMDVDQDEEIFSMSDGNPRTEVKQLEEEDDALKAKIEESAVSAAFAVMHESDNSIDPSYYDPRFVSAPHSVELVIDNRRYLSPSQISRSDEGIFSSMKQIPGNTIAITGVIAGRNFIEKSQNQHSPDKNESKRKKDFKNGRPNSTSVTNGKSIEVSSDTMVNLQRVSKLSDGFSVHRQASKEGEERDFEVPKSAKTVENVNNGVTKITENTACSKESQKFDKEKTTREALKQKAALQSAQEKILQSSKGSHQGEPPKKTSSPQTKEDKQQREPPKRSGEERTVKNAKTTEKDKTRDKIQSENMKNKQQTEPLKKPRGEKAIKEPKSTEKHKTRDKIQTEITEKKKSRCEDKDPKPIEKRKSRKTIQTEDISKEKTTDETSKQKPPENGEDKKKPSSSKSKHSTKQTRSETEEKKLKAKEQSIPKTRKETQGTQVPPRGSLKDLLNQHATDVSETTETRKRGRKETEFTEKRQEDSQPKKVKLQDSGSNKSKMLRIVLVPKDSAKFDAQKRQSNTDSTVWKADKDPQNVNAIHGQNAETVEANKKGDLSLAKGPNALEANPSDVLGDLEEGEVPATPAAQGKVAGKEALDSKCLEWPPIQNHSMLREHVAEFKNRYPDYEDLISKLLPPIEKMREIRSTYEVAQRNGDRSRQEELTIRARDLYRFIAISYPKQRRQLVLLHSELCSLRKRIESYCNEKIPVLRRAT